jgi:thiol-disulfide isomerase/thioredoxin
VFKRQVLKKLSSYPSLHKKYNNLENFTPSEEYYNGFKDVLPITDSMFICGSSISEYINNYHFSYVMRLNNKESGGVQISWDINEPPTEEEIQNEVDSLMLNAIIKYTPDTLLRQMVLAEYFLMELRSANISTYENYNHIINEYINQPYLFNPLTAYYKKTKKSVDDPKLTSEQILKATLNSNLSELMDSVLNNHKNKIIYIDCWATWCGPCISEMPNSKILWEELKGKDVGFVYFCLDSEKKKWKAMIDKHQIKGEHYLLSKEQSDELRNIYEVTGIPHYIIIDKKGTILGKEYNLRPQEAYGEIIKLLN